MGRSPFHQNKVTAFRTLTGLGAFPALHSQPHLGAVCEAAFKHTAQHAQGTPHSITFIWVFSPDSLKVQFTSKCHCPHFLTLFPQGCPANAGSRCCVLAPALVPGMCPCPVTAAPTWKPFEALSGAVRSSSVPTQAQPCRELPRLDPAWSWCARNLLGASLFCFLLRGPESRFSSQAGEMPMH